jgi:hypothetical protein
MKKLLSVILAVIMLTSVFCINVFATETPKADALLDRLETEDEVLVSINSGNTMLFGFMPSNIKNTVAVKGNTIAYEYSAGILNVRIIASEDGVFAFIPALPFFYVKLDKNPFGGADVWGFVKNAANLTQGFTAYVESYNETVDGKEYYVEEYNDREFVTSKFYYIGDELKMLRVEDVQKKTVQYTYFDGISFDIDDKIFDTPVFAIDLTPILMLFFSSLLGTILPV